MADVSKIQGPSGSPEKPGKDKSSSSVDADKFKQEMRRRVTEVSQVDPDEQKKRKRPEEAEEENIEAPMGPTTPPELVTPFSLEEESKKISPDQMMKGPRLGAQGPAESSFYSSPSPSEMADDSGFLEEPSFEQPPAAPAPSAPSPAQPSWTPEGQEPVEAGPPEETPTGTQRRAPPSPEKNVTAEEIESGQQPKKAEETKTFFEQMKEKERKPEELAEEEAEVAGAPMAAPLLREGEKEEKAKKVEDKEEAGTVLPGAPEMPLGAPAPLPAPESLPPYATLHPQVMELFERMAGVMTVMTMSGMTETTITLNAPQFASSVFFGSQIIIQEFSSAPKAFNIQLNGNPQAVAVFQANTDDLMAAFQAGNYNFRVNRLETGYLTDRPLFKRKEKAGGKEKETGEQPQ